MAREAFGLRTVADGAGPDGPDGPVRAADLAVWDRRSAHHDRLDSIAGQLFAAYQRFRDGRTGGTAADRRDLTAIMGSVRDALQQAAAAGGESRALRKRLAAVGDRLMAVEKEKNDLIEALSRHREVSTTVDRLRHAVAREREKNVHLQSVVDDMYDAAAQSTPH